MDFYDYLLKNFTVFYELFGLLVVLFISVHIPSLMKRYTRLEVILLFVATIVSYIEMWTQTFNTFSIWRFILTATKYTLYPVMIIVLILILSTIRDFIPKKWKLIALLPLAVSIPIYYTTQWTHFICFFTQDNHYLRGTFVYYPYIIFAFYFALFIIYNGFFLNKLNIKNKIMYLYMSVGSSIGVVLFLIKDQTDDFTPIFTSALLFYFLFLYIHLACIDPLTKTLNRQSYYQEIENSVTQIEAVISVDMNELKQLNDTYGHAKGDLALITVCDILNKYSNSNRVYRVGGDEFIILYRHTSEEEIKKYIYNMEEELAKTEYSCAFGFSMYKENVEDTIKKADEMMYDNKQKMKLALKHKRKSAAVLA